MAIAPIDLQTLFTQVDKVGKAQMAQREGQAMQQAMQGVQLQRKADEVVKQVNETQDTGEGVEKLDDKASKKKNENKNSGKTDEENENETDTDDNKSQFVLRDPALGNKIDISY